MGVEMKATGLAIVFAAATLLLGCSDALPTGPAQAPAPQSAIAPMSLEGQYLPLSGLIGVRVGNARDGWYAIEGTVEYLWVDQPTLSPLTKELRLRTEAKMSCVSDPERTAQFLTATTDVIDLQKANDPIVKRYHVTGASESFDLVLVLQSKDGDMTLRDMWLERTTGGGHISDNR
jgi:hypothetical protein